MLVSGLGGKKEEGRKLADVVVVNVTVATLVHSPDSRYLSILSSAREGRQAGRQARGNLSASEKM